MNEYGTPAEWAASQKWSRRRTAVKAWSAGVLTILAAGLVSYLVWLSSVPRAAATVTASVLVALAMVVAVKQFTVARSSWKRAGQAKVGVASERKVRKLVRKHNPPVALYGMTFGKRTGDLDLTVVTDSLRVLAVEIKTGFGQVSVYGNQLRAGRSLMPRDPLGQAARNARRLADALQGLEVVPMVCIPGMTNRPFITQGVVVCSAKDLFRAAEVVSRPQFESQEDAQATMRSLWQRHLSYA